MIFDRCLSHFDEFSIDVEVYTLAKVLIGKGKLSILKDAAPQVRFDFGADISKLNQQTSFNCKSADYNYQLLECDLMHDVIIPKLVIRGSKRRLKFRKVRILFQGLSQWFDERQRFDIADDVLTRSLKKKVFNAEINYKEKHFSLCNEHLLETKNINENSHQINEYTVLTLTAKEGSWSATELLEIIHLIQSFFTLLLGQQLGLEYVLDASDKKSVEQSIYFLSGSRENTKEILSRECFVPSRMMFDKNNWQVLLQGYFSSQNSSYRDVWTKISGMLSYKGFWEYSVLAYVSLVDRYVSIYSENKAIKIPSSKFKKYKKAARKELENIKSSEDYENAFEKERFCTVLDSMCCQIDTNIKNTSISSFPDKFFLKFSETNLDLQKILDFKKDDFDHVKKIRNSVAHGGNPNTQNTKDITYEVTITNKLSLLLHYWTLVDIGLSHVEFIKCLNNWLCPQVRNAQINETALHEVLPSYFFFDVNKTNFQIAKKYKNVNFVFNYIKASNTLKIDIEKTEILKDWSSNWKTKPSSIEIALMGIVDTYKVHNIAYLSCFYLKYGGESLRISSACILNCPENISFHELVRSRLRVFDRETNMWLPSEFERRISSK